MKSPTSENGDLKFVLTDEQHACYYKGKRQPSVGTILKNAAKAFNPWAKDDITPEARARMERGKILHETLDLFDRGDLGDCDDGCKPYIDAWGEAMKALKVEKWETIEEPRFHEEKRYWGILDRGAGDLTIDIKTGTARPSSYRVQVAGYCILWGRALGAVVYLSDAGKHDIEWITKEDFDTFEMALKLAERGRG